MQHLSAILDDGVVYMILFGVAVVALMTMVVYAEGLQNGRIEVASGQWQCEKIVGIRQITWECKRNAN